MIYTKSYWNDVDCVVQVIPDIMKLYGKSILCAGATGMMVSSVTEILFRLNEKYNANINIYLAGRDKERIRKRFTPYVEGNHYKFISYDATSSRELGCTVDYIINGASNANPATYVSEPVETIIGNIAGLNTLLKLAVKNKGSRLLYVSSSEIYGIKLNDEPYGEEEYGFVNILDSRACYPNAKRVGETLCVSSNIEYGLSVVIVRPGHIYGPTITESDTRATAQFSRNAIKREDIVMKSPSSQLRSYCYTLDCASAILTVLINGKDCNAYNISNNKSIVTIRAVAEKFAQYGGSKLTFENSSDIEARGYNLMSNSSLKSDKIESLGWRGIFDIDMGVKKTIEYMKINQGDIDICSTE